MPTFLALRFTRRHLVPQTSDLLLNQPESYFFIQYFLIIACGVLYALCYVFYAVQVWTDRYFPGTVFYLALTMVYEIYYAIVYTSAGTSTWFERPCFLVWFCCDVALAPVALFSAYKKERRFGLVKRLVGGTPAGIAFLWATGQVWPDERDRVTAFWMGTLLQLPIGWGQVYLLLQRGDTKGFMRFLGSITALGVFAWRSLNVAQNWAYVGSL
ncbi:hypothetical protein K458DRAFT_447530 [Lentithecium fluviatile CBS 122367]|uniref:Uncharacterized protein n=1 Tax=Lentithecium fluviatile CBS 122367 TaxID=1168545 RepID=A0A6G1IDW5_9PLEO|nr:hypothetical protein K458DRAFT_447530 [Lentithecium fluviatile CBS 122367]